MLELQRLLIKDNQNNLFRILQFGPGLDEKNEPYVKICFPYFDNTRLYKMDQPGKVKDNLLSEFTPEYISINEFTYHYESGVSHFKFNNSHTKQNKKLPTIKSKVPLHLLTIYIFDLNSVPKFTKKIGKLDFALPNAFNVNNGRMIDIYIRQLTITPEIEDKSEINYFDKYEFEDNNLKIGLSLIDYEFKTKPQNTGIIVSRPSDPHAKFS
ncbi:MAG: hypothetical protein WC843_06000 [Candidatus Gracilibacteria bacterium]|jgi:hypothetical protein